MRLTIHLSTNCMNTYDVVAATLGAAMRTNSRIGDGSIAAASMGFSGDSKG
jgi:hypothetical protein